MSLICYYVRLQPEFVASLCARPDAIFDEPPLDPIEVIDIDRAYEPLAWLASPLKRAEIAHTARLVSDTEWPDSEAGASVARLDAMAVDDVLAAIEGRGSERIDAIDFGMGAAVLFPPERVRILSAAVSALSEAELRGRLDFRNMDENDVLPGYWEEEGEAIFGGYLMPAVKRLQEFYASAAANEDAVIVVWA